MKRHRSTKVARQFSFGDKGLLIVTICLVVIGLITVADASAPQALAVFGDKYFFVKQQLVWAGIGIVSMFVVSFIPTKVWEALAVPTFLLSVLALLVVLIPGVGTSALGARRWIVVGPASFQPSEFAKFALVLYLAKVAKSGKGVWSYFIPVILVAGLVMFEPDLGTTMIIVVAAASQIFVSGINLVYFAGASIAGVLASLALILTSDYRRDRLMTYLQMSTDPLGKGYHVRQVLLSLGTGGLFGVGLGQSKQKYLFLPESATDSIFAVIAEEAGFIGALVVIAIFGYFLFRAMTIAGSAKDKFSQVLAVGITAWIVGQVTLNIGSMVALVPLTGIPLPFFSYGGSALVMVLTATGILLGISKNAKTG